MKKVILIVPILFSLNTYAGTDWMDRGNAGYVVQCPSAPLQTLDLHEAQNFFHLKPDTQSSSSTQERFLYLVSKIEKFNPTRAALYKSWYQLFESDPNEVEYVPKMEIAMPTNDLGTVWVAEGCKLEQVVFQRQQSVFNKARYTVNLELWNQLSPVDQAALIFHEFAHREFSTPPSAHETSETARKFNGWVNSEDFNSITLQNYLQELQNMFVVKAEYHNHSVLLAYKDMAHNKWVQLPLDFLENGLARTVVLEAVPLYINQFRIAAACTENSPSKLKSLGQVYFNDQGYILLLEYDLHLNSTDDVETCVPWSAIGNYFVAGHTWEFDENENLQHVYYMSRGIHPEHLPIFGDLMIEFGSLDAYVTTVFGENFQPKRLQFKGRACMNTASGKLRIIHNPPFFEPDKSPLFDWDLSDLKTQVSQMPVCTPADFQAQ